MSIKCGSCSGRHGSVAEVKLCYRLGATSAYPPQTMDEDYRQPVAEKVRVVDDGMYRSPETGTIYKVQRAIHGSGKLYAKKMVQLDEPIIKRRKECTYDFVYAPGIISRIDPSWKMTLDDAKEFGQLYGACVRCGTVLTDETSIEAGIGPICATKM